ncbi:MAG: alanine--tRNA ligase [Cyclobacteriaceae bacterium]|nr:alanine--tRNA ligase [Cyclobacteriaceae bacterium]
MVSNDIRKKFLEFFQRKQHEIVPSAPMVIKNDPTLMFTNAGMNQFKDYFLGHKKAESKRIADTQKCLRVSGKHNDLEEVGLDTYHHTMFEMLGNWSFGDYFKDEAIAWAWELLTEEYELDPQRLYATYFGGDEKDGLEADHEALEFWKALLPEDRILPFGKADNFWEMGETGPCGPCSEIHYDLRSPEEREEVSAGTLVNQDHPQVIEIWNLVFIQFNRLASGSLESLPENHVDTGMGFERLVRAIQEKSSNYDTDLFQPIIEEISSKGGIPYGKDEAADVAMRVIADHLRALVFAIADGEIPSNNKAGYVIRRILRRAVRYGYTFLDLKNPFMYQLVPLLATKMGDIFPEIDQQKEFIGKVIQEEESAFLRTLSNGLNRFNKYLETLGKQEPVSGSFAFELYDTYGFPLDLTQLMAREQNRQVDTEEFAKEMKAQKDRSRSAQSKEAGDWIQVRDGDESVFMGYEQTTASTKIVKYRQVTTKDKSHYQLVLDQTPFYAESGGQVGDTGYLLWEKNKIKVWDTKRENNLIIHMADKLPNPVDATIQAEVDRSRRRAIEYNHSATHLLHAALRKVLGDHVQQRGSLVSPKILRFDFSHFSKVSDDQIQEIEQLVNSKIRENITREVHDQVPLEEAKSMGAMALFGEKYGDKVRVISFDPGYSIELCGGTHVPATGHLGLFKIISESSVASGIRRIEALTGEGAEAFVSDKIITLEGISDLLKHPKDTRKAVENLLKERGEFQKQLEKMEHQQTQNVKARLLQEIKPIGEINSLVTSISLPSSDALKGLSFELRNQVENLIAVLAADIQGKPQIAVVIGDNLVKERKWDAGAVVRELAALIKGGGGGQAFYATAGGKDLTGLPNVVNKGQVILADMLGVNNLDS